MNDQLYPCMSFSFANIKFNMKVPSSEEKEMDGGIKSPLFLVGKLLCLGMIAYLALLTSFTTVVGSRDCATDTKYLPSFNITFSLFASTFRV